MNIEAELQLVHFSDRFGASSMPADIERQLEHRATGRYSADYRHPIA